MLDDRVRAVLERLQRENADERERGLPAPERSRAVAPTTGQFLFALIAPQVGCEVLEIGASRGYSTLWLAAGVRHLGGRVLSLESDPAKAAAWRANIAEAGLEEWAELIEGDAKQTVQFVVDKDTQVQGQVTVGTPVTVEYVAMADQNVAKNITAQG